MKAVNINKFCTEPAPKEWAEIPEVKEAAPNGAHGYIEVVLQRLSGFPKTVQLVQWWGAKNGFWYPASDVFRVSKSGIRF